MLSQRATPNLFSPMRGPRRALYFPPFMRKFLRVFCQLYADHPRPLPCLRALLFASPDRPRRSPFSAIWRGRNARLTRAPPRIPRASFSVQQGHVRFPLLKVYSGHRLRLCTSPSSVIRRKRNARRILRVPRAFLSNRTRLLTSLVPPCTSLFSAIRKRRNARLTRVLPRESRASRMPWWQLSLRSVYPLSL